MIGPSVTILLKDLRLRLRDRSVFMFAVVVPLGLTVLFSFILPSDDDLTVTAALIDEDGGEASAAFADELLPTLVDAGVVIVEDGLDPATVEIALEDGSLDAAWRFPEGFSDALQEGRGAEIEVLVNDGRPIHAEVARGIAESYASQLDRVVLAVATTAVVGGDDVSDADLAEVAHATAAADPLVSLVTLDAERRQLDGTSYLAAGMAAFFVFFTVQFGVTGLLEERQLGTLPRLLAAPIHPAAVQIGKAAGAFVLGIVSMTVLAVASGTLLGADWGPPLGVAILIVALVLAAVGLMAFVGSFAKTAEQAGNLQSIVAVVLGMLGGVFFPVPFGGVLQYLTRIAPHGWFLRSLADQYGSGQWWAVVPGALAITAFGVVAGLLAALRLRRSVRW